MTGSLQEASNLQVELGSLLRRVEPEQQKTGEERVPNSAARRYDPAVVEVANKASAEGTESKSMEAAAEVAAAVLVQISMGDH